MNDVSDFDPSVFFTTGARPGSAQLLGFRFEDADPDAGTITISFEGKPEFTNPAGFIQGGLLIAMLDDTMGPAVVVASRGKHYAPTITLNAHFLRPVRPGRLRVDAKVTQLGRSVAFVDSQLYDERGRLCVTASVSCHLQTWDQVRGSQS
ncbi:MAG: PaaI family thioesterase [Maricaulaceae bacterium]|jgi:uncharacterized protein (TIGR00369 family)